jgi:hypothetical protein
VNWHGSIANSDITLLYEFTDASGNVKLAQGQHGSDGSWTTTVTNQDSVYTADSFNATFYGLDKITY